MPLVKQILILTIRSRDASLKQVLEFNMLPITILKTNTPYPSRRYGVSVPALTKDHKGIKTNTPYPENSIRRDLDNSTNNVLIPLDSWTSGLLVYRLPLSVEYGVSTFIGYGVSSSLTNTAYSSQQINTEYPLPLDTAYRSSGTETEIFDFRAKIFLPSFGTNPTNYPEREFRSSRKHFKSLSLDELRSSDFNLLSDEEYSEEEEEAMAETMEQYMSKTQTNYGSGVARPKIDNKDQFELKGQFLKELRENTFSGSDNEDANEHIEKVLKIVDLFHVLNITVDQLMLQIFPISLTGAASRWLRNEPTGSIKTWEDLKTKFLNKYCPPGRTAKGAVLTKIATDAKTAIQEMAEYSQKWHNGTSRGRSTETSDGLATIQAQLNNLGRKIKKVNEKVYAAQERGFGSLPSSTETNLRDQVKPISTTIEADLNSKHRIGSNQYAVSTGQNSTLLYKSKQMTVPFPSRLDNHYCEEEGNYGPKFTKAYGASHINNTIPRKEKDPGSFTLPCFINNFCFDNALVDLGANVSVMPLPTYLNLGLGELAHTRLRVELVDWTVKYTKGIAKNVIVGIGKFTFPIDFIILDMPEDIKVPLILRRSFLSTACAKIDVYKRKITLRVREEKIIFKSVKPASILEDMDAYRDNEMGDIIFGEPFLREVVIKTKRFEGIITLYNGDDEVTYQMVRSHPRFKHHTNEQCNKISPLLKVSDKDKINRISHAYQKLKGFYKGVLNL
ncbi:gag-pol polyprotein [Tanacetum coccineum]